MATEEPESSGVADFAACEGLVSASEKGVGIRQILWVDFMGTLSTGQDQQ